MVLAEDVLRINETMLDITDASIQTSCPTCHATMALSEAAVSEELVVGTVYRCSADQERILIVGRLLDPDTRPRDWGYRVGNFVLRNATDLRIQTDIMGTAAMLIPASADAMRDI